MRLKEQRPEVQRRVILAHILLAIHLKLGKCKFTEETIRCAVANAAFDLSFSLGITSLFLFARNKEKIGLNRIAEGLDFFHDQAVIDRRPDGFLFEEVAQEALHEFGKAPGVNELDLLELQIIAIDALSQRRKAVA